MRADQAYPLDTVINSGGQIKSSYLQGGFFIFVVLALHGAEVFFLRALPQDTVPFSVRKSNYFINQLIECFEFTSFHKATNSLV